MAAERRTTDGDAVARWLGESGELVSRYEAAVGEHVGRMASVNADLRRELAGARATAGRLQALVDACVEVLGHAMLRSDGHSLHLAGFRVWEMLTGATEAQKTGGAER